MKPRKVHAKKESGKLFRDINNVLPPMPPYKVNDSIIDIITRTAKIMSRSTTVSVIIDDVPKKTGFKIPCNELKELNTNKKSFKLLEKKFKHVVTMEHQDFGEIYRIRNNNEADKLKYIGSQSNIIKVLITNVCVIDIPYNVEIKLRMTEKYFIYSLDKGHKVPCLNVSDGVNLWFPYYIVEIVAKPSGSFPQAIVEKSMWKMVEHYKEKYTPTVNVFDEVIFSEFANKDDPKDLIEYVILKIKITGESEYRYIIEHKKEGMLREIERKYRQKLEMANQVEFEIDSSLA